MIMKRSMAFTLTISTFIIGVFQIINDDYLARYGLDKWPKSFQWIDDNVTGAVIVGFALIMGYAFLAKRVSLQQFSVVALGSLYFSLGTVYAIRAMNGYQNITWILLYTLFFILIFAIRYKGDRWLYERTMDK
ncbi:hypothetical protein [Enterococcus phage vB_EfaS_140]|uniref:Uncharacterized protein n=1 Tax=Enterococcus phage vB_EfaS_140 TaxID=2730536 RepID=A0ACA9ASA6_9CAUD|nr:hypothetical protein [Enterococcus phage vB_EfaS_140]